MAEVGLFTTIIAPMPFTMRRRCVRYPDATDLQPDALLEREPHHRQDPVRGEFQPPNVADDSTDASSKSPLCALITDAADDADPSFIAVLFVDALQRMVRIAQEGAKAKAQPDITDARTEMA